MALSDKQKRFVAEYIVDLNATAAYKRAGYTAEGHAAEASASRLLSNVEVQQAVKDEQAKRNGRVELTQDYVIGNLVEIVERCMQRAPVLDKRGKPVTQDGKALWTFNGKVATAALKLLGDHKGMFGDKLDVRHSGVVKVLVAEGGFDPDAA